MSLALSWSLWVWRLTRRCLLLAWSGPWPSSTRPHCNDLPASDSLLGTCENPVRCHSNPSPHSPPPRLSRATHASTHSLPGRHILVLSSRRAPRWTRAKQAKRSTASNNNFIFRKKPACSTAVAERGFLAYGSWKIPFLPAGLALVQPQSKAAAD